MSLKNIQNKSQENQFIHSTALIEDNVCIGPHSKVWDNVHIRKNSILGHHTSIGEKTYIAYDVKIGNYVKINAMVYICTGVLIEDQCMISAGTVFTNDRFPRAMNKELTSLEISDPTEETLSTYVRHNATIGANATIGPGVEIGPYAMIGMGSVVTQNIPAYGLVVGNPAKLIGYVCLCGPKLIDLKNAPKDESRLICPRCERTFLWKCTKLELLNSKPSER